jgi:uncharacterized protein
MKDNLLEKMFGFPEIREILEHPAFLSLSLYRHHGKQSRLLHVVAVAELVFVAARLRGFDAVSATRAALLHDFYFYDRSMERRKGHWNTHPLVALENAMKYFELNDIERDAIERHMWPITNQRPRFQESRLVSLADKASTLLDVRRNAGLSLHGAMKQFRRIPAL